MTRTMRSAFSETRNRSTIISPASGMCSKCTEDCESFCEIALSAVLGARTVYPTTTGANQVASEKEYPISYADLNINGRVFGADGLAEGSTSAEVFHVNLERSYGTLYPVKLAMPVILPALIKLNWRDYFAGAAMAGVSCVVGEDARLKDPGLQLTDGKVTAYPWLAEILSSFNTYDRGYGQIIVQCNTEDDAAGVPEIALTEYGAKAIEFKFGQSAKGTQPVTLLKNREEALAKQAMGSLVHPDPSDPVVAKAYEEGVCPNFYVYARLPMWDEDFFAKRIQALRDVGMQNVYFKMASFDKKDMERVLRIAIDNQVDMVTFDGAGGGSGYSPCKMMNEWGLPAILLEHVLVGILEKLQAEGHTLPAVAITGGFAAEDQVFKALAMGHGLIQAVGLCRASMAAAMRGKQIGEAIRAGETPEMLASYGSSVEEVFLDLPDLRALYGKQANAFSTGAIGVFSYLNRIAFGLKHFGALNRKFDVRLFDRSDLLPLTEQAKQLLG
jgi:hypothetical protein